MKALYLDANPGCDESIEETKAAIQVAAFEALKDWDGELGIGLDASYENVRDRIMELRRIKI